MPELSFPIADDRGSRGLDEYLQWSRQKNPREYRVTSTDPLLYTMTFPADVVADIEHFQRLLMYCRRHELSFPCLQVDGGDPIPVDWASFLEMAWTRPDMSAFESRDLARFPISYVLETLAGALEVPPADALGIFYARLRGFIGVGGDLWGRPRNGPGLLDPEFTVNTRTKNLRVHYSRAYLFNPRTVFGGPTSPVSRKVMPGRYVFGVADGAGYRFDPAEYDVPPETEATLDF